MAFEPWSVGSIQSQRIVMEKLHLAFHQYLPDMPALDANASIRVFEHATGGLVFAVKTWMLEGHKSDTRPQEKTIEYPASWWEFLKQDHAPKWFLRRWPVKMKEITYTYSEHHHFVCPHVAVDAPHEHYMWMATMSGQLKDLR